MILQMMSYLRNLGYEYVGLIQKPQLASLSKSEFFREARATGQFRQVRDKNLAATP